MKEKGDRAIICGLILLFISLFFINWDLKKAKRKKE